MELIGVDDIARREKTHVKREGGMIKCRTWAMPTLR